MREEVCRYAAALVFAAGYRRRKAHFVKRLPHFIMNKAISRIPHPTRCFLAALGRATFSPGEGTGTYPWLFAKNVAFVSSFS